MNAHLPAPRLHPALLTAAISVSALALAGIGVLTGAIPFTHGASDTPPALTQPASVTHAASVPHTTKPTAPVARHVAAKPVAVTSGPDIEITRKAPAGEPGYNFKTSSPAPVAAPSVCNDCGIIEAVREIAEEGEASGIGAVAGSVVGGLLGHQIGAGHGKDLATVLGAIGGGMAGHKIEKSQNKKVHYEIVVRFDDGTSQVLTQDTPTAWRQGDRVKVVNGVLSAG